MNAIKKLSTSRTRLILDQPFFGVLALKLHLVGDTSCQTAWVDGRQLGYNPEYIDQLSLLETIGIVAHEVLHCALNHLSRLGSRNPKVWNEACDHVVNLILTEAGFTLPDGVHRDKRFTGMSAEDVYRQLMDEGKGEDEDQPDDSGGCGVMRKPKSQDGGVMSEAESKQFESDWQTTATQAVQQAKMMGKSPGAAGDLVLAEIRSKVDWKAVLRRFITQPAKMQSSWRRPNRRFAHSGLYFPTRGGHTIGDIVVAYDTSASTDEYKQRFHTEVMTILREFKTTVHLVFCDTRIQKTETLRTPDDLPHEVTIPLGGGTRFHPVFEWVEELQRESRTNISCLVYLTDLECSMPKQPKYPVLWACSTSLKAPWGQTVCIQD